MPSSEASLPSPPFYSVEGVHNLRDLGGYGVSSPSNTTTKKNFIYRSAQLTRIAPSGAQTLVSDLGIKTIYDLRSTIETTKAVTPTIPGAQVISVPVFQDGVDKSSPEKLALRYRVDAETESVAVAFARAYSDFLTDGVPAFRTVFTHIRDQPTSPFLIHCAGGKDRTGVLAALMLRIAGVTDDEVISNEYQLTKKGMEGVRSTIVQSLLQNPAFKGNQSAVETMISAEADNMKEFLKLLDGRYGGAEGYLKSNLGFGDEDIAKIKGNLLAN